jgi:glycosyltransferase involved in cell wall biosynthesis
VGARIARQYGGPRPGLLEHTVSLTPSAEVAKRPVERDWSAQVGLLTVGRIEPEKAPLLLVEALAELERRRPGRFSLTWAGTGRLAGEVRRRARELDIDGSINLVGYVPFGPELMKLYRDAHLFVHVALTEGLPQVLLEAMAAATPIVATDVGGVSAALEHGAAGILVAPGDRDALVDGVLRMVDDPALRRRSVESGITLARRRTLEAEAAAVAGFIAGSR